jgi:hypothetical protein
MNFWQGRLVILVICVLIAVVIYWLSPGLRRQRIDVLINYASTADQLKRFRVTISRIRRHLVLGIVAILPAIFFSQFLMAEFHIPDDWASIIQLLVLAAWAINLLAASVRAGMVKCPKCDKDFFRTEHSRGSHPFSQSCYHCGFKP